MLLIWGLFGLPLIGATITKPYRSETFLSSSSRCPRCAAPSETGKIPASLSEASGYASSKKNPGVFYIVEDGPEQPLIHMVDEQGASLGQILMTGIERWSWVPQGSPRFGDFESLVVGPCSKGSSEQCIFVADIGNNCARPGLKKIQDCPWMRENNTYSLLRVPEPNMEPRDHELKNYSVPSQRLPFHYPDGPHDAEALLLSPKGSLYVVTKDPRETAIYELPEWPSQEAGTAKKLSVVSGLEGEVVTAADFLRDGSHVSALTVRTYRSHGHGGKVLHYPLQASMPDEPAALIRAVMSTPCPLASNLEQLQYQGEGLVWQGSHLVLCAEGKASSLFTIQCSVEHSGGPHMAVHILLSLLLVVLVV